MTAGDIDPEPPYTEDEIWAAFERVADCSDHYDSEAERVAFIDAVIAYHMCLADGTLPAKYMLSQADTE